MSNEADIVERLRERSLELSARSIDGGCQDSGISANLCDEAADLIDQISAERDEAITNGQDRIAELLEELKRAEKEIVRLREWQP